MVGKTLVLSLIGVVARPIAILEYEMFSGSGEGSGIVINFLFVLFIFLLFPFGINFFQKFDNWIILKLTGHQSWIEIYVSGAHRIGDTVI